MKNFLLCILVFGLTSSAQTTLPSNGKVGIGIIIPLNLYQLKAAVGLTFSRYSTNHELKKNYSNYYNKGDLRGVTRAGLIKDVYIWGYQKQYLEAVVRNATYQEVLTALGGFSVLDQLNRVSLSDSSIKQKMVAHSGALPQAEIMNYTYPPLIGMSNVTDAMGKTIFYKYEDFYRLQHIKDQDGTITKSLDYHFKS